MTATVNPLRSLLFCPATEPTKVLKIPSLNADAAAVDLEDAVSDSHKTAARATALDTIADPIFDTNPVYVRVNGFGTGRTPDDIRAVVHPNLTGIVLAKTDDADSIREASRILDEAERAAGLPAGQITILPLLETASGVYRAADILAASTRIETAIFGFVDYMLDVGIHSIDHTPDAEELLYARSAVVMACRVAGVTPPLDGPFLGVGNPEAFLRQCRQARSLGYRGKMLIHPSQIEFSHEGFAPSPEEVEQAQRILDQFAEAERRGVGAIVVDGRLVDYPVKYRAEHIVTSAANTGF
ncbi:HpcH/HpaI aldolase/citrate lyase family protein [Rhodococcus sp. NPDC056960]|uniref:HpcH/HpaI aldolase/citrate lyase family protein n=1 Tax=Rhodococcus sp. NPDC056960 TaxID=3345982 RepID=UPI00362A8B43